MTNISSVQSQASEPLNTGIPHDIAPKNMTTTGTLGVRGDDTDEELSALERFCTDVTEEAKQGVLDPLVGRDDEVRRLVHILCRRTKNNPILLGRPGVGKTAIVEGLAQRIVAGDVPTSLLGARLLELDLGAVGAGCQMPGEFEERLSIVVSEVVEASQKGGIIMFIDDIHNLCPPPLGVTTERLY